MLEEVLLTWREAVSQKKKNTACACTDLNSGCWCTKNGEGRAQAYILRLKKIKYMTLWTKQSKVNSKMRGSLTSPPWHPGKFLAAHQDRSAVIWLKSPRSRAEALPLTTSAPKAGVSEPITAQTDLSADNHSFWVLLLRSFWTFPQMCVVKKGKKKN